MGQGDGNTLPLYIKSIILQKTSSNLESVIGPLTILDNIMGDNVTKDNVISNNSKDVSALKYLFSCILSEQEYEGNEYVWNTLKAYIMNKKLLRFNIDELDKHCKNKKLLKLIFYDLIKSDEDKYDAMIINKNQNLLRPEMLKVFENVTKIWINTDEYPISLEALLFLINGTQIKELMIYASYNNEGWLPSINSSSSIDDIKKKYAASNFKMDFGKSLMISHISVSD